MRQSSVTYLLLQAVEPVGVTLFDMLPPEVLFLEELVTFRNLASPLVLVLLLDDLDKFIADGLLDWASPQLSEIGRLGFKDLINLVLKCLDPIVGAQKLLLGLV